MDAVKLRIALCSRTFDLNQTAHDPRVQTYFKTKFGAVIATAVKEGEGSFASGSSVDFMEYLKSSLASGDFDSDKIKNKINSAVERSEGLSFCIIAVTEENIFYCSSGSVRFLHIRNSKIKDLRSLSNSRVNEMKIYRDDIFVLCSESLLTTLGSVKILGTLSGKDPANCCSTLISEAKLISASDHYSVQVVNILSGDLPPSEVKAAPVTVMDETQEIQTETLEPVNEQNEPIMAKQKYSKRSKKDKSKLTYGIVILLLLILIVVILLNVFKKEDTPVITDTIDTTEVLTEEEHAINNESLTVALKVIYSGTGLRQSDVLKHIETGTFNYKGERSLQASSFDIARLVSNISTNNLVFEKLENLSKDGDSFKASFVVDFRGDKNKYEMVFTEGKDDKLKLQSITFVEKVSRRDQEETTETPVIRDTVRTTQQEPETRTTRRDTLSRDLPTPRRVTDDTTGTRTVPTPKPVEEEPEEDSGGNDGNNNNGTNNE